MDNTQLRLRVTNTSEAHNMGIELWLDQTKFFDSNLSPGTFHVVHNFQTEEQEHNFKIVLKNKNDSNTTINEAGDIVTDSIIDIKNFKIDEIEIDQLFNKLSVYRHNNNGHSELSEHKFFGHLGCNGTVEFKFASPIYLWLLENM